MASSTSAPPVARCPLGFTGTPPAGHPTIPSDHLEKVQAALASTSSSSSSSSKAAPKSNKWSPATVLTLDAIFLLTAVLVAVYWNQIEETFGLKQIWKSQSGGGDRLDFVNSLLQKVQEMVKTK